MAEWSAEVVVGHGQARALIADQCFEPQTLRLLAEGWDNTVWVVDERWVFRFPRRQLAIPGVEREMALLPRLAPVLPLPVPEPVFLGRATDAFPWPFFGAALVPGSELAAAGLDDAARAGLARPLGEFLRALHATDVPGLPADPFSRADMPFRTARTFERFEELGMRAPAELLEQAAALPPSQPTAVCHGDLHIRHLLVQDGRASGVIDWGDLCRGDPAIDMSLYWCALPPAARPEFLAAYGPVSEAALLRARVLALFLCGTHALYGRQEGVPALEREALGGIERALT